MRNLKIFLAVIIVMSLFAAYGVADCGNCNKKAEKKAEHKHEMAEGNQELCPIMGNKINKDTFIDYNGKRIYFCCAGCEEKFLEDPAKFMVKAKKEGVEFADAPVTQEFCPVTGNKIDKEYHSDYKGKRVYFCSQKSKDAFDRDPEKYIKKVK